MTSDKTPRTIFGAKTETLLGDRKGDRALRRSDLDAGISEQVLRVLNGNLPPKASQAQAEAATDDAAYMTALKTKQQADARLAALAEAQAGVDNAKLMTPLRTFDAITARLATAAEVQAGTDATKLITPATAREILKPVSDYLITSGVTAVDIALPAGPSSYKLKIIQLRTTVASGAIPLFRFSYDGGATFDSGSVYRVKGLAAATQITSGLTTSLPQDTYQGIDFDLDFPNFDSLTHRKSIFGTLRGIDNAGDTVFQNVEGYRVTLNTPITHIRMFMTSRLFAHGRVLLYPVNL